ncbi:MAG: hypothetical protein EO766_13445 [Hydrotalea sp. AMD]|uniref:hypothetical protein n=1 Tax=Hydrotalea sp. AMD TaxID=2501297 RepID=UPI0010267860|nr:hypothetical protein [Hydrotalea sp. AMD]RWZ86805.1 MAG: hypothetical protein EO766_13445 [Hydrotalea sp. AMD]
MRLFTLDANYQVELNKEWIMLIPEFAALLKRDKGSQGDYRGDKKLKARREFTFIYFDLDFTSPIREYPDFERREEAMKYAGLTEADLDGPVMDAHRRYEELLFHSSRSLKTLKAVEKSLDALDQYFQDLDFTLVDKKGELVHSPNGYLLNLERLGKAYDSVDKFRKRVAEELKGDASIRGTATLGRREAMGGNKNFSEGTELPAGSRVEQTDFSKIGDMVNGIDDDEEPEE